MPGKAFEDARINQNDDGTYTISITPPKKKEKNKAGELTSVWEDQKTYTAATMEEAIAKIKSFGGGDTEPEKGSDDLDIDGFMNPERGEKMEPDEKNEEET